jgi:hypothetical protein
MFVAPTAVSPIAGMAYACPFRRLRPVSTVSFLSHEIFRLLAVHAFDVVTV